MEQQKKPSGFEDYLSEYSIVLFDGYSGEPVAWGFIILRYLGEGLFKELGKHGELKCIDGFKSSWALVTKSLSREEAIEKYGSITHEDIGPRGGWKSTTFGDKKFISDYLRPIKK